MKKLILAGVFSLISATSWAQNSSSVIGENSLRSEISGTGLNSLIELGISRNLDEFSHSGHTGSYTLNYTLNRTQAFALEYGYYYRMNGYESSNDPSFIQEDISLSFSDSKLWSNLYDLDVSYSLGTLLPTSETSQRASLRGTAFAGLAISKKVLNANFPITLSQFNKIYLHSHRFTTANEAGTVQNSQYDLVNGVGAKIGINQDLSFKTSASLTTVNYYEGKSRFIQGYTAALNYAISKQTSVSLSGSTKDAIISNNSLFDDDNTWVGLGISISL